MKNRGSCYVFSDLELYVLLFNETIIFKNYSLTVHQNVFLCRLKKSACSKRYDKIKMLDITQKIVRISIIK